MSTRAEAKETMGGISNDGNLNMTQTQTSRKGFCSVRHGLAFILHLCNLLVYTQQMNLSIAIPAMVNNTALSSQPNASTKRLPTDPQDNWNETLQEIKAVAPVYDWSPKMQGIILSSFSYGSFLTLIPTGYLAGIFGAKYMVGAGLLISSILTLFMPMAADTGVTLFIVLRIVQGIAQVMVLTGQHSIWVKWAPPLERSQLITIAMSGAVMGCVIIFLVGGLLCQTIGWPYVFYIFGGIGCGFSFLWFLLIYENPMNNPFISTAEKEYIVHSLAQQDCSPGWSVPIKAMIKSLPLWAILVSFFCHFWTCNITMAYTPTYINSVLQTNLRDSGFLAALPRAASVLCIILGSLLADFLFSRKILRLITIRKLFITIGNIFSTGFLLSLPWVQSSHSTTIAFLVLSSIFSSLSEAGILVNVMDIAPRYTAFLNGLTHVFVHISGAISPMVAGYLISQDSEFGWRNVFLLSAAIDIGGLVFYLIFGQAKVQDWAEEQTFTHF